MTSSAEKPAVWAEADVASLAAALMVQRPPARAARMRCSRPSVCAAGSEEDLTGKLRAMGLSLGVLESSANAVSAGALRQDPRGREQKSLLADALNRKKSLPNA